MSFKSNPQLNGFNIPGRGCGGVMPRVSCGHRVTVNNIFTGGCCCNSGWGCGSIFGGFSSGCCCNSGLGWAWWGLSAFNSIAGLFGNMFGGGLFGNSTSMGIFGNRTTGGTAGTTGNSATDKDATPIANLEAKLERYANAKKDEDKPTSTQLEDLRIQIEKYYLKDDINTEENKAKLEELLDRLNNLKPAGTSEDGVDGADGKDGKDGKVGDGKDGNDGKVGDGDKDGDNTTIINVTINNQNVELKKDKLGDEYDPKSVNVNEVEFATDGEDENSTGAKTKDVKGTTAVSTTKYGETNLPANIGIKDAKNNKTYMYKCVGTTNGRGIYKSENDPNNNVYILIKKGDKFYLTQPYANKVLGKGDPDKQNG